MKTEFSIYIFTFTTAFVFTFSLLSFSEYSYTEGPPESGRVSHIKQLYNELDARGQGSDEPGEAEFQSQENETVEWDYGDVWNRIYSASFPRYPFGYERIPDQYLDYLCYLVQSDYRGPIHFNNSFYFKYSDSSETGKEDGCPTPDTEAELDEIWEWYEEYHEETPLGDYIARDNWSGLLWTAPLDCGVVDGYGGGDYEGGTDYWSHSRNLCAGLGEEFEEPSGESDGHSGWNFDSRDYEWRLPTKNELMQIAPYDDHGYDYNDDSGHGLAEWTEDSNKGNKPDFVSSQVGESFNDDIFWSQNLRDDESRAFLVRPSNGNVNHHGRTSTSRSNCVRCVAEDR